MKASTELGRDQLIAEYDSTGPVEYVFYMFAPRIPDEPKGFVNFLRELVLTEIALMGPPT